MALDVIGVAGSPRAASNSTALLDEVLDVARRKGLNAERIDLNRLCYRGCQACHGCQPTGRCIESDDLCGVYEKLEQAHVWVFASPVYFDGICGQLKTFLDRLYCFTHEGHRLPGLRRGALILTYEDKRNSFYEEMARRAANYFTWFGCFEMIETLPVSLMTPGAVLARPDVRAAARQLGERLTRDGTAGGTIARCLRNAS